MCEKVITYCNKIFCQRADSFLAHVTLKEQTASPAKVGSFRFQYISRVVNTFGDVCVAKKEPQKIVLNPGSDLGCQPGASCYFVTTPVHKSPTGEPTKKGLGSISLTELAML
jgi:hypothetical protein